MSDLSKIKTFKQLLAYLQDELDWPVEDMEIDDLTFDYDPEDDLGLDPRTAAKVKAIKQLRPLKDGQPFGIFFVEFEPKALPVTALRRILGKLVTRKRASANPADRKTWAKDDLIFASVYGDDEHRRIDFAHFADDADNGLPTLRVLGWDGDDTDRKLDWVESRLKEKLHWPEKESTTEWRARWRDAFILRHREAVTTSKQLARELAALAQRIRKRVLAAMKAESKTKGPLHKLHKAFQDSLIHDLNEDRFADMYAQTIAYGLLSARMSRPTGITADDAALMIPNTNPFLKELMEEFLRIGGRDRAATTNGGIDFDELGVNDVVDLLRRVNVAAIVADFGRERPGEDPVIHFYEYFMEVYDKKEKVKRGVFYTPKPVVSFIVRSVDEILREEFGLPLGLADTTTWGEMASRHPLPEGGGKGEGSSADGAARPFTIPTGVKPEDPFVQILDPATGTGTFLVETIDLIHARMVEHWKGQKKSAAEIDRLWNQYVPEHLLQRLYGFELMMAPYAIAHMKIGLKLADTGYRFRSEQRLRVFLTNSLEPPTDLSEMLEFVAPFLAHEARAASDIKKSVRPTVLIGNPPYAAASANPSVDTDGDLNFIGRLMRDYYQVDGVPLKERNPRWLQDDYVKFLRVAQHMLAPAPCAVLAFITNNGYVGNPTFRGLRRSLMTSFSSVQFLDLHGSSKKQERSPDGSPDENVFDIQQSVGIGIFVRGAPGSAGRRVSHADVFGVREGKYRRLAETSAADQKWNTVDPIAPFFIFEPQNADSRSEYMSGFSVTELFAIGNTGIITKRDALTIHYTPEEVWTTVNEFLGMPSEKARLAFDLPEDVRDWKVVWAQADLRASGPIRELVRPVLYRPFDVRYTYYTGKARGFLGWPVERVMRHFTQIRNVGLITARSNKSEEMNHFFVTRFPPETKCGESTTQSCVFPMLIAPDMNSLGTDSEVHSNLTPRAAHLFGHLGGMGDGSANSLSRSRQMAADVVHYCYALFHSIEYRRRYAEFMKVDFPRVLLPSNHGLYQALGTLGSRLVALHLLDATYSQTPSNALNAAKATASSTFHDSGDREVRRAGERGKTMAPSPKGGGFGRVHINDTAYFDGIPAAVWSFHIGGYQVCHKWLSDRKGSGSGAKRKPGRVLTDDDIAHYHKIVIALNETIRIMGEIDKVIEEHGGWPGAFITDPKELEKLGLKSAASAAATQAAPRPDSSPDGEPEDDGGTGLPFA